MRFVTMGSKERPAILLIPGLSASADSCYGEVARILQEQWHVVLCELDGHYDGSPAFVSVEDKCGKIEGYVRENLQGRLWGMAGLSFGGTIAVSILGRGCIQVERTLLDGAFCVDMGLLRGLYAWLFPAGIERVRDGKYVPGVVIDLVLGKGNRSIPRMLYPGITAENCRNACRDVYSYRIPENLKNTSSRLEFWRGSREPYPKRGAELLRRYVPSMAEQVLPGMGHCQFLCEHPAEYARKLSCFMSPGRSL